MICGMSDSNEYVTAIDKAVSDLESRVQKRDLLNAEIAGLRETVRVLSGLVGIAPDKQKRVALILAMAEFATPSLNDAIRSLLTRKHPREMTPTEIRNALEDSNFNFGDFSNPLSACHSALKRMKNDGQIEEVKSRDGKIAYRMVLNTDVLTSVFDFLNPNTPIFRYQGQAPANALAMRAGKKPEDKKKEQ